MELIADYIKDDRYLEKLNDLTNEVFGFSFEDWVKNGYYTGEYIPYSFLEDGKIVSNVSANIMKFKYNNENKKYIQIGTVMTSYSFRNRSFHNLNFRSLHYTYQIGKISTIWSFYYHQ